MITLYPYAELGHANHGWLDARHHFSFAQYRNPARRGFGALLVINDDRIEAGKGFGMHSHADMEIITYVREGAISHRDSLGNDGRTGAGDVQVMSAGTGVMHSEENKEAVATRLYQIWIAPNRKGMPPRWEAKAFPKQPNHQLTVLVSGMPEHAGSDALMIYQDAAIYGGRLKKWESVSQPLKHQAYVLASSGRFTVNGQTMQQGDGAEATHEAELHITALEDAEILVIDVPE